MHTEPALFRPRCISRTQALGVMSGDGDLDVYGKRFKRTVSVTSTIHALTVSRGDGLLLNVRAAPAARLERKDVLECVLEALDAPEEAEVVFIEDQ